MTSPSLGVKARRGRSSERSDACAASGVETIGIVAISLSRTPAAR
jgi:hypothetical protein